MIYIPTADQAVRVNMEKLGSSSVKATWYDPRTGQSTFITRTHGASVCEFITPKVGPDWVLVLDAT